MLLFAYLAVMPSERLSSHSPYNHFALQARAWLDGRLDLGGPPPRYTGFDDFAVFDDRYFVSFPPVPSLLLLPFVAVAGAPERVLDPLLFACLAPLGPALLAIASARTVVHVVEGAAIQPYPWFPAWLAAALAVPGWALAFRLGAERAARPVAMLWVGLPLVWLLAARLPGAVW
ncbi:MAG: hypothetical protein RIF41_20295, partial [Polyangiaceae bacterium]